MYIINDIIHNIMYTRFRLVETNRQNE